MASRMFAVDLGAWSVKLAIASPGMRGATLLSVIERLVPPGDEPAEVRARGVLAELVREMSLAHETGYIGVFGDQVFTQVLEFGFKTLRRADLEKAVGNELEGVVPVDLEDMVYTFEPIPIAPAEMPALGGVHGRVAAPSEGMRVLTYAMRRERAEALLAIGKEAGFEPRGVLAVGGAAMRLVERLPSLAQARTDGAVAVVDIGHDRTDVVIVAGGKAVFSRGFARAGKHVTQAIQRQWPHLSWHDAELAKHTDGFVASQAEPALSDSWAKISLALMPELQPFARELRQTFAACRARTGFSPVATVIVGGGARLRGFGAFLSEQVGVPTWRPSPDDLAALAGPRLAADVASLPLDSAAMTVGMAYDSAGGRPQFDLRSGSLAVRMDLGFLRQKAVPLGAAAIAICAFAAVSAFADLHRLKKAEGVLAQRLATDSMEVFKEKRSATAVLNSRAAKGTNVSPMPKMSTYDLLLLVNSKIPGKDKIKVDMEVIQIDDQKVELTGTAGDTDQLNAAKAVDELVKDLEKIECFKSVTKGATETAADGGKKFKLSISAACM